MAGPAVHNSPEGAKDHEIRSTDHAIIQDGNSMGHDIHATTLEQLDETTHCNPSYTPSAWLLKALTEHAQYALHLDSIKLCLELDDEGWNNILNLRANENVQTLFEQRLAWLFEIPMQIFTIMAGLRLSVPDWAEIKDLAIKTLTEAATTTTKDTQSYSQRLSDFSCRSSILSTSSSQISESTSRPQTPARKPSSSAFSTRPFQRATKLSHVVTGPEDEQSFTPGAAGSPSSSTTTSAPKRPKNYRCSSRGCQKSYVRRGDLTNHMNNVHPDYLERQEADRGRSSSPFRASAMTISVARSHRSQSASHSRFPKRKDSRTPQFPTLQLQTHQPVSTQRYHSHRSRVPPVRDPSAYYQDSPVQYMAEESNMHQTELQLPIQMRTEPEESDQFTYPQDYAPPWDFLG